MKKMALALLAVVVMLLVIVFIYLGGGEEATVNFKLQDGSVLSVTCEVADSPEERTTGLSNRNELAPDRGMLFVFEEPRSVYFWMKDTVIPLDMIFIAENGTVLNVEEALVEPPDTPNTDLTKYHSAGDAKWVVEINMGLSSQYGIGPGTVVEIIY